MSDLPFSEACERNKRPIAQALSGVLPATGEVLEIGSGTGQHIVFFARQFPALRWQPSDRAENLRGLSARIDREGAGNIRRPVELNVLAPWPDQVYDAVYSANTAHIMGWRAVRAMFGGVGRILDTGGVFALYGPFNEGGRYTAQSNAAFDRDLRTRDPQMGIRDIEELQSLAGKHRMVFEKRIQLPANNQLLVFRRPEETSHRAE